MSFPSPRYDPEEVWDPNADLARADVGFVQADIETDQGAIAESVFGQLAELVPGWQAHDGNLDVWLVERFAEVASEIRALALSVPDGIFTAFGSEVLGLPMVTASPAVGFSRWTAVDDRGYTIMPDTEVTVAATGDNLVGFRVSMGAVIPPGQTSVDDVELVAVIDGAMGNGLFGPAEVSDPLDWVESVELTQPTRDGEDGQTAESYLERLSRLLRVMAFRPVLPADFSLLALLWVPGVGRAVAMDGYDPSTNTWGHVRTITVVVTDPEGLPLPQGVMDQIRDVLEAAREVNFRVYVIPPLSYDTVDVSFEVTAFAEQDREIVLALAEDALRQLLSPAQWRLGVTTPATEAGEVILPPGGLGRQVIRLHEIVGRLDRVRGVDWVGPVRINGQAQDYVLTGPASLPRPGEIQGTVYLP